MTSNLDPSQGESLWRPAHYLGFVFVADSMLNRWR